MLSLRSFHVFFIAAAIVLTGGFGAWGLMHEYQWLGAISLLLGILLVVYFGYFMQRSREARIQ